MFLKSTKNFFNEKEYEFLVLLSVKSYNANTTSWTKILSVNTIVPKNVNLLCIITHGRLVIRDTPFDAMLIEVSNCLDNLIEEAKILKKKDFYLL